MSDDLEYELLKTDVLPDSTVPVRPLVSVARILVVSAVAIVAAGIAAYVFYFGRIAPAPAKPIATAVEPARQPARPLGGDPEPVAVPPLDESDSILRELVRRITSHPSALAWLTTNGLIRNFTVVVANVVDGVTPARHLRVLRPLSPFRVVERHGKLFVDPRSYERYDGFAEAVASIDPAGGARLYATLKPRIEEAYGQLGFPPNSFDSALEKAIVSLLQTPAVEGTVQAAPNGIVYRYADPNLENLTAAQKQLLCMGPRNTQIIQSALRRLAVALGIPTDRLS
jgi:hypothetical protein